MTDDDARLHEGLRSLAGQVRPVPLDLVGLRAAARRRVRRRRLLAAVPAAAAVLVGLVLLSGQRGTAVDRLAGGRAPGDAVRIHTSVTLRPPLPGVSIRPETATTPVLGHRTEIGLVWSVDPEHGGLTSPQPNLFQQVRADAGPGTIGVVIGPCANWDDRGRAVEQSCPAPNPDPPVTRSGTTTVRVSDVVPGGRMAPGTYRFSFAAGPLGDVDVVLAVTGTQQPPPPPPVLVSGTVVAEHGRGLVVVGRGRVPATLTFARALSDATYRITTTDGRWSTSLPPGTYAVTVTVTVTDGTCPGQGLTVVAGQPAILDTTCRDGASTF